MPNSTPETLWQQYKSGLQRCADALLRKEDQPRAPWMSDNTWAYVQSKQDSYKALKHAESEGEKSSLQKQYRKALNDCRRSVKADKRAYWKAKAVALEADFAANRVHAAYKRVGLRDELDKVQSLAAGKLRRSDGSHTSSVKEKADIRKQHFQELLNCHRPVQPLVHTWVQAQHRDSLQDFPSDEVPTLSEVQAAVNALKNYKAAGVCGISPEMIKYGGQDGLKMLHTLISNVWHTGVVPEDWRKALIVPLFKKGDPTNIDNYRGISLLSLPGKVFAILLKNRLQRWAEGLLLEAQCGFRKGRSCNDAIYSLNGLCELTRKTGNELHACFIDLSKAYDSVDRPLAWELFESMGFPPKMLQLIKQLHHNTTCAMQADKDKQGSWFQVSTGFKQGDVNAPLFFNIFLDNICRYIEARAGELGFSLAYNIDGHLTGRRKPNGSMPCWILLYADDMVIFEKNRERMQAVLATVYQALQDWGMQMSIPKTKYLCYNKAQHFAEPMQVAQHEIEQVHKFRYLGNMQTSDLSVKAEISNRLASAANAWLKLSKLHVWDDECISRGIKCTLYKVIVQSTLLYASETWAFPKHQMHRLDVFQMKCLRKICKVSLKDKIRNETILGWCNVAKVSNIVSHRRLRWLGHLARMPDERLPKRVLFGHMDGSGVRGNSQKQWVDYVREDLQFAGLSFTWWRKSQDRAVWRAAIECLLQRT